MANTSIPEKRIKHLSKLLEKYSEPYMDPTDRMQKYYDALHKRQDSILDSLTEYDCPPIISDEFSIIERETREMIVGVLSDDDSIERILPYLYTQKKHLSSIYNKVPQDSLYYEQISTLIVKSTLFHIDEKLNLIKMYESFNLPFGMQYIDSDSLVESIMQNIWKVVECLDTFKMSYLFKYDVYDNKRKELKGICIMNHVDTKTKQEKRQAVIEETTYDLMGCVIKIAVILAVGFIIYLIIGK